MNKNIFPLIEFNKEFNKYLPYDFDFKYIYRSRGLEKHIQKRHPECLQYVPALPLIISKPDYIGVNPNEKTSSFELIKILNENVQVGIKLDAKNNYLYIATLYTITEGKLRHGIENGRLKKFDK